MSKELVKALIIIARTCAAEGDCRKCPLREYCGKLPSSW